MALTRSSVCESIEHEDEYHDVYDMVGMAAQPQHCATLRWGMTCEGYTDIVIANDDNS